MPITLDIRPTEEIDLEAIRAHATDAQVPFREVEDDELIEIECADDATADFWVERFSQWGAEVLRDGEAEQQPVEAAAYDETIGGGANEVLPGDSTA